MKNAHKHFLESMKYISLALAVLQNTSLVLLLRYTRTREGDRYFSSFAVVVAEVIKVIFSFCVLVYQDGVSKAGETVTAAFNNPIDSLKVSIPAGIYALQNNLLFYGLSNLPAPTYQLKVFTTAILSVVMLHKELDKRKWISLVVLFVGICIVQLDVSGALKQDGNSKSKSDASQNVFLGMAAVFAASCTSGFAGVYFEKILKGSNVSLWLRNIQLGLFGSIFGFIIALVNDYAAFMENGFFFGWDGIVFITVLNQAIGGLIIAVVVKYADNILKGFASSLSIILSSILAVILFQFEMSILFLVGSGLVMLSIYLYRDPPPPPPTAAERDSETV